MKEHDRDEDFDDIIEGWEIIPLSLVEIKLELDINKDPIVNNGYHHLQNSQKDVDFDNLPNVYVPFVRCNKYQREHLEWRIGLRMKWHYWELCKACSGVIGRKIRSTGEMSFREAERCIEKLE